MRSRLLTLLPLATLAACGAPEPDTRPPVVVSTSPDKRATGVALDSEVWLTFNEALDPATVSSANVTIGPATGTVRYDGPTHSAVIAPSGQQPGENVTVTASGVKDLAGNPMAQAFILEYTTLDN
jgi:predicted small lipoprotein YifL